MKKEAVIQKSLFEKIVSEMAEGVNLVGPHNLKIIYTNKKFDEMFGYGTDELIGKHVSILNYENEHQSANKTAETISELLKKNNALRVETLNARKDGTPFVCSVNISSFYLKEIGPVWISIHQDITEQKNSEKKLQTTHNQFLSVLNNLNVAIYVTDMNTYEILFVNKLIEKLFGKNLTGKICWKVFHSEQTGPCSFCTNDLLIDNKGNPNRPYIWEFHNRKTDKWFELRDEAILWPDGRLVRLEIATDITTRKYEELIRKKENALLENKIKERTSQLDEMNTALKVLLNKREEDKSNLEKSVVANYEKIVQPYLKKLKSTLTTASHQTLFQIIETNLTEMLSPFSKNLSAPEFLLTPSELKVANLIRQGFSSKEIAEVLNTSVRTVTNHRVHIRKKLGLTNTKTNLRTYLDGI